MKKLIIVVIFIFVTGVNSSAQENHRERIKAYKTAYITQELDLSSKEAEKFWPVYNQFEKKIFELRILKVRKEFRGIKEKGGMDILDDKLAAETISNLVDYEKQLVATREEMYLELSKILTSVKLLKLYKAEMGFNKKLLSEFRRKKHGNN